MAHREGGDGRGLPGDDLIGKLKRGWTGLRAYEAPAGDRPLSWWERRKQAKALRQAAADSLKPHIVHTPAKPARARE